MSAGTLRQYDDGPVYHLPCVPQYGGSESVEMFGCSEGIHLIASGELMLTPDEARRIAEYLIEAAAWLETVHD